MSPRSATPSPANVVWDLTYACPLRCLHCYSESGRRPTRRLGRADQLRVADALISMRPRAVILSGGEPLVVPGVFAVAERFAEAGIPVALYTGGWPVEPSVLPRMAAVLSRVGVSVDGATAEVHDRIRGRAGSFERALRALDLLDQAAGSAPGLEYGLDCSVVRGNLHQLDRLCSDVVGRFPRMAYVSIGVAVPSGVASGVSFAQDELLTNDQVKTLTSPERIRELRSLVRTGAQVAVTDNQFLQMHPDRLDEAQVAMHVEPDGGVRAMSMYEGVVGNLLREPAAELWERTTRRWSDPFVVETLSPVDGMTGWAQAARRIDSRFGSVRDRARIARHDRPR